MNILTNKLHRKISMSDMFVVMATRNYLDALRNLDGEIIAQIGTAHIFGRPFFIVIDKRLSQEEREEIDIYFSEYNIIRKMEIDFENIKSMKDVAEELKRLTRKFANESEDGEIRIITMNSKDDEE